MANQQKIKPKRSEVSGKVPAASQLETHEIAINYADGKIFGKNSTGNIVELGTSSGNDGDIVLTPVQKIVSTGSGITAMNNCKLGFVTGSIFGLSNTDNSSYINIGTHYGLQIYNSHASGTGVAGITIRDNSTNAGICISSKNWPLMLQDEGWSGTVSDIRLFRNDYTGPSKAYYKGKEIAVRLPASLSEKDTGETWIDGKTIYERTYQISGTVAADAVLTVATISGAGNFGAIIAEKSYYNASGIYYDIHTYLLWQFRTGSSSAQLTLINKTGTQKVFDNTYPSYVTVRYTK